MIKLKKENRKFTVPSWLVIRLAAPSPGVKKFERCSVILTWRRIFARFIDDVRETGAAREKYETTTRFKHDPHRQCKLHKTR